MLLQCMCLLRPTSLLPLLVLVPSASATTTITTGNIRGAVSQWVANEATATAVYGPLSGWDVSQVESFDNLFYSQLRFNADISR